MKQVKKTKRKSTARPRPKKTRTSVKKKPKKNGGSSHILVGFIGMLFVAYVVGYFINRVNKPEIVFATVENGSIDLPVVYNGIIIRDEEAYTADKAGTVYFAVSDRERVKKGTVVCRISNEEIVGGLSESLSEVEKSIMEMQQRRSDITIFAADTERLNKLIKESVDDNVYKFIGSDFLNMYSLREEIDKNLTLRNQKLLNEDRGSISTLVQEKDGIETRINENIAVMTSREGGVVSYQTDGLENVLTFDNLLEIREEQTTMIAPEPTEARGQQVEPSQRVFKLIKSNEWYMAAYLDNKVTATYKENAQQTLYVNKDGKGGEFNPMSFTVSKIIKQDDTKSCVLFKASRDILSFADIRSLEFKTERSVYSGLKVPNTAIIDRTFLKVPKEYVRKDKYEISSVIKREPGGDVKINISPQSSSDESYIYISTDFRSLLPGNIIVSPDNTETTLTLSETVNMRGLFRVNNGLAEFVKVNVDGEILENSGYCVLDPGLNPSLRAQDRIIPEPRNIIDGQMVY